jgi:hypothetical protein
MYPAFMSEDGLSSNRCFVEIPGLGRCAVDCRAWCRGLAVLVVVSTAILPWLSFALADHGLLLLGGIVGWWWLGTKARQSVEALDLRLRVLHGPTWAVLGLSVAAGVLLGRGAAELVLLVTTTPPPTLQRDAPLLGGAVGQPAFRTLPRCGRRTKRRSIPILPRQATL